MNFVLAFLQIYFVCYAFGTNVTTIQSKMPKSTCGIKKGGPIVQQLTKAMFTYPTGLIWANNELVFVDFFGPYCNYYKGGKTFSGLITELGDTHLHAMIPILDEVRSYLLVANKSLYKGVFDGFNENMKWTITKVMDVFVNTNWSLTRPHASKSNKLWAASNTDAIDQGEVVMGDIPKYIKVIDANYTNAIGLAWNKNASYMYTVSSTCVYRSKFYPETDKAGKKEVLFEMKDFTDIIQGELYCVTVDEDGNLWICVTGPGMVIQYNIESHRITQMISVPGDKVVNAQFGGSNYEKLIVATWKSDNLKNTESGPGALYAISAMGAKGFAPNWINIKN